MIFSLAFVLNINFELSEWQSLENKCIKLYVFLDKWTDFLLEKQVA